MTIQEYSTTVMDLEKKILEKHNPDDIIKYLNLLTQVRYYIRWLEKKIISLSESWKVMINQVILEIETNKKLQELKWKCDEYDKWKILEKRMNKFLDIMNNLKWNEE